MRYSSASLLCDNTVCVRFDFPSTLTSYPTRDGHLEFTGQKDKFRFSLFHEAHENRGLPEPRKRIPRTACRPHASAETHFYYLLRPMSSATVFVSTSSLARNAEISIDCCLI